MKYIKLHYQSFIDTTHLSYYAGSFFKYARNTYLKSLDGKLIKINQMIPQRKNAKFIKIHCTNHEIIYLNPDDYILTNLGMKKAKDIDVSKEVLVRKKVWSTFSLLPQKIDVSHLDFKGINFPLSLASHTTPEFYELCAIFIVRGTFRDNYIDFQFTDDKILERIRFLVKKVFDFTIQKQDVIVNNRGQKIFSIYSKAIMLVIQNFVGNKKKGRRVRPFFFKGTKEEKIAFVRGILLVTGGFKQNGQFDITKTNNMRLNQDLANYFRSMGYIVTTACHNKEHTSSISRKLDCDIFIEGLDDLGFIKTLKKVIVNTTNKNVNIKSKYGVYKNITWKLKLSKKNKEQKEYYPVFMRNIEEIEVTNYVEMNVSNKVNLWENKGFLIKPHLNDKE